VAGGLVVVNSRLTVNANNKDSLSSSLTVSVLPAGGVAWLVNAAEI